MSGNTNVGGLVGWNEGDGSVSYSYSTAFVSGTEAVGGVVGKNDGPLSNSYFDWDFSDVKAIGEGDESADNVKNVGRKTTAELAKGLPTDFSDKIWTAGEFKNENGTLTFKLPYLKTSGEPSVPTVGGSFSIELAEKLFTSKKLSKEDIVSVELKIDGVADAFTDKGDIALYKTEDLSQCGVNGTNCAAEGNYRGVPFSFDMSEKKVLILNDGYYEIGSANQLYWFAELVNGGEENINGKLVADIVVNEHVLATAAGVSNVNENGEYIGTAPANAWTPIGIQFKSFTGTFDGNGKTISGLYFNDASAYYVGLFGIADGATIKNVRVVDSYFNGSWPVGGIVGYVNGSNVDSCYSESSVNGKSSVGGIVGKVDDYSNTLSNNYNAGPVSGNENVGGILGYNGGTVTVKDNLNSGSVRGSNYDAGGIIGASSGNVTLATAFSNNISIGSVSGTFSDIGCFIGNKGEETFENNYYNSDICSAASDGATGKTTAEFFADTLFEGLDEDVWVAGTFVTGVASDTSFYPSLAIFKDSRAFILGETKEYTISVAVNDEEMGSVTGIVVHFFQQKNLYS